ncbi:MULTISPECIES: hypothetical protein [Burkholderiales]|nr:MULTISPECIES: hypothetical protein [Burkholderia cepacia complex]MCA8013997.1 hypothetical protein [Burkholderia vietnamiensis]
MMAADSLRVAVHLIVPSGVSIQWLSACRRVCSASASAPHFALPSNVQASCLERARPAAIAAFAGALAASSAALPGRRRPERQRRAKAEGKIEGRGTTARAKPVCTWVGGGTRHKVASCRQQPQGLAGIGNTVCRMRSGAMGLVGTAS